MEKATSLGAMLRSFRVEPLEESQLEEFFCSETMVARMKIPLKKIAKRVCHPFSCKCTSSAWLQRMRKKYRDCKPKKTV